MAKPFKLLRDRLELQLLENLRREEEIEIRNRVNRIRYEDKFSEAGSTQAYADLRHITVRNSYDVLLDRRCFVTRRGFFRGNKFAGLTAAMIKQNSAAVRDNGVSEPGYD